MPAQVMNYKGVCESHEQVHPWKAISFMPQDAAAATTGMKMVLLSATRSNRGTSKRAWKDADSAKKWDYPEQGLGQKSASAKEGGGERTRD